MDIDLLSKMVKEAVIDHDTVTLPGVGSFVAELVPATFADRGYTILPPYRRLSFSPREGEDRLLVSLYARANDIPEADAARILEDFLAEMKDVLRQKKIIVFPGLGRLRATLENHFFFVADEDLDIYPAGFGLGPISLKTHEETKEEVAEAVSSLAKILEPETAPVPEAETPPVVPTEAETVTEPEPASEVEAKSPAAEDPTETEPATEVPAESTEPAEIEPAQEPASETAAEDPAAPTDTAETEPASEPVAEIPEESTDPAETEPAQEPAPAETKPAPAAPVESEPEPLPESPSGPEQAPEQTAGQEEEPAAEKPPLAWDIPDFGGDDEPGNPLLWKRLGRVLAVLLGIVLLALVALAVTGRVAPEWLDGFLYTPEELDILRP